MDAALDSIIRYPELGVRVTSAVRFRLLRRFPFKLSYRPRRDRLEIIAVRHCRQRPLSW